MAGIVRDDKSDSQYLNLAKEGRYDGVGQFTWSDSQYSYSASGTVIDGAWVLTAAHVLDTPESRTFKVGDTSYQVTASFVHPKWTANLSQGYDIALAKLDAVPDTAPANLYKGSSEAGKIGTFVGYGMTGTGLTGAKTFDEEKRAGNNMIDVLYRTGKDARMFGVDFDNPKDPASNVYGKAEALELEYLTSFGDSGGGVFIDIGSTTYLAGVVSWGADYNGNGLDDDYGDIGGYTRVSSYVSWIDSVINGTGGGGKPGGKPGGGPKPRSFETLAVPEPSSVGLLALGALGMLRRRRD